MVAAGIPLFPSAYVKHMRRLLQEFFGLAVLAAAGVSRCKASGSLQLGMWNEQQAKEVHTASNTHAGL